jgi:hypothetical protein
MPVRAFTSEVFPWSIWPAVPTMTDFIANSIAVAVGWQVFAETASAQ